MSISGKKIVVTGVSSGIGAETSRLLKEAGAMVIGLDRNEPAANVDQFIQVDLSCSDSINRAISQVSSNIDGLANVAGVPPTAGRELVLKVNFLGLRQLTLGLVDKLNDGAGIANVASMAGFGWPKAVPTINSFIEEVNYDNVIEFCDQHQIDDARSYSFVKEALIVWTMKNRWTWRDRGVRMNTVSPGPVDTPILNDFLEIMGERGKEDMKVTDRAGTPQEIAPAVVFLCSEDSRWLRGTNIACDGGLSSHVMSEMFNF